MKTENIEVLSKVKELYHKYGIKSVTMEDLSRHLGISKKTLYQYFTDKEDLVKKVIEFEFCKIGEEIKEILTTGENALEIALQISAKMRKNISQYPENTEYDLQKYYPKIYEEFTKERRKYVINSIVQNLKRGVVEGYFRQDLKPEIIARLQLSRIESKMEEIFQDVKEYSKEEILMEVFVYHLRGICSAKGIEYLEKNLYNKNNYEK